MKKSLKPFDDDEVDYQLQIRHTQQKAIEESYLTSFIAIPADHFLKLAKFGICQQKIREINVKYIKGTLELLLRIIN